MTETPPPGLPWDSDPHAALTRLLLDSVPSMSPGSLQVYQAMLASALRRLASAGGLAAAGEDAVARCVETVASSPRTAARYAALLDRVFASMVTHGQRQDNPAARLLERLRSPARPLPVALLPEQEARFRQAIPSGASWRDVRDRAVIAVLLDAGLKLQEVQALRVADCLTLDNGLLQLSVRSGRVERRVTLAPAGVPAVREWLALRAPAVTDPGQAWLFPSDRLPASLHAASVYRIVEKVFRVAGLKVSHRGAEVLRATFAARQFRAGRTLSYVQGCLGHRFPESTLPIKRVALAEPPAS